MKKIINLILFSLLSVSLFCQINIKSPAIKKREIIKYDSLTNYLKSEDATAYIGQSLHVVPKHEDLRKIGYENFFTSPTTKKGSTFAKLLSYSKHSTYEDLVNRTFKVIDVITQKGEYYGEDVFLKIFDQSDTLYYLYPKYEHSFSFIVQGYIENLNATYLNKNFYFTKAADEHWTDFETGLAVKLISCSQWVCKEVALDGENFMFLNCILQNQKGETVYCMVDRMKHHFTAKEQGD